MAELYGPIHVEPTYSPWTVDEKFQATIELIRGHTIVGQLRQWELWKLIEQVAKLSAGNIIEVGVWRGGTGALIAKQAENCGITDKVFLCDTFTGIVKAGPKDSRYRGGEHANTNCKIVEELIYRKMNLNNVQILEGVFPEATGHHVEALQFRFCHIDVDVYQSAKDINDWIWGKMVSGGVIVYDDYGFFFCDGITKYVEEQMKCKDRLVIYNLNGHAVVIKL
jgi:O-methyltransferase